MLKTGNGQPQDGGMEMPPVDSQMGEPMPQDDGMMGGGMPQDGMPMGDGQGGDMGNINAPQDNGGSDFDTNFDAGVQKKKKKKKKKYIQQLTGKLSTTLNSYNSENGDDEGLNKYVAKMIVKASTKNMDDAAKKDIIKAINTSQNPEPDDDDSEQDMGDGMEETPDMQGQDMQGMEQPLQERVMTKKQLKEMAKRRKKH